MVEELARFKKLQRLDAVECQIDDTKLKLLRNTAIKELNIDQNLITGYSLRHTLNNMKLNKLSIRNCNDLDDTDIKWFKNKHRQVRLLDSLLDSNDEI